MNHFFNKEEKRDLMVKYLGKRVRLLRMEDIQAPPVGSLGTITDIDDAGNLHTKWDNGSSLSLIPGVDSFELVGYEPDNKIVKIHFSRW